MAKIVSICYDGGGWTFPYLALQNTSNNTRIKELNTSTLVFHLVHVWPQLPL